MMKNLLILMMIRTYFCSIKNVFAGKWETFYGALRKLREKLLEYNIEN